MKQWILVVFLATGFSAFAESVSLQAPLSEDSPIADGIEEDRFLYVNIEVHTMFWAESGFERIVGRIFQEDPDPKKKYLPFLGMYINLTVGYGQNIILRGKYFGFFESGLKIFDTFPIRGYFLDLKYGWDLWQKGSTAFGWDTFHNIGFIEKSLAFGNGLGVFANFKQTDSLSFFLKIGLSHHNTFKTMKYIFKHKHFGPYFYTGMRYYL